MINQTAGTIPQDSRWDKAGALVAGDNLGFANRVTGVRISVPRNLVFRRIYVAGFCIPAYATGYQVIEEDARFVMCLLNQKVEFARFEWGNPNGVGQVWPISSNRLIDPDLLRPQFRVSNRAQVQPFMFGWPDAMVPDGVELSFRTQNATPAPAALEWMVTCAPFRLNAAIDEIVIDAERSTMVTPDQLAFFVGCLSSEIPV